MHCGKDGLGGRALQLGETRGPRTATGTGLSMMIFYNNVEGNLKIILP